MAKSQIYLQLFNADAGSKVAISPEVYYEVMAGVPVSKIGVQSFTLINKTHRILFVRPSDGEAYAQLRSCICRSEDGFLFNFESFSERFGDVAFRLHSVLHESTGLNTSPNLKPFVGESFRSLAQAFNKMGVVYDAS